MKYNWSIIGHELQLEMLERDLRSGNLPHAYLLGGPNSVGKHTVAKKLCSILQCQNDFCHECSTCLQIERGNHLDTIELKGNNESIKIEDVRKIIERLNMTRQYSYKILLIQSVERMTIEAANSFLKVLEEPTERTIFILTTNNIQLILPTILSRVRTINFNNVSFNYLFEKLKGLYPDSEEKTIKEVCLFSMGKTGKAVHLMENPDSLAEYQHIYNEVQGFLKSKNVVDRFSYVDQIKDDQKKINLFLSILTHVVRSKMFEEKTLVERKKYVNNLLKIDEAGMLLRKNVNLRLVLENLMVSL